MKNISDYLGMSGTLLFIIGVITLIICIMMKIIPSMIDIFLSVGTLGKIVLLSILIIAIGAILVVIAEFIEGNTLFKANK